MPYSPNVAYERFYQRSMSAGEYDLEPISRDDFLALLQSPNSVHPENYLLDRLPEDQRDAEVCLYAVNLLSENIRFVPEQQLTEELCIRSLLNENGINLCYIPQHFRTPEVCYTALAEGTDIRFVMESIPRDHNFYMLAVSGWGANLGHIPPEEITPALCHLAVREYGDALDDVPRAMRTWSLCLAAVKNSGMALEYVPEELCDEEICLAAVVETSLAVQYVPPSIRTPQFWGKVLKKSPSCLSRIPEEELTEEALLHMFSKGRHGYYFRDIPESLRTEAVCIAAVRADADNLKKVPPALKERVKQALQTQS